MEIAGTLGVMVTLWILWCLYNGGKNIKKANAKNSGQKILEKAKRKTKALGNLRM